MPAFPEPDGRVYLVTDASDTTVEAAITQIAGQDLNLLFFFFSAKLSEAKLDRELFAVYCEIIYFRHMLKGRDFRI